MTEGCQIRDNFINDTHYGALWGDDFWASWVTMYMFFSLEILLLMGHSILGFRDWKCSEDPECWECSPCVWLNGSVCVRVCVYAWRVWTCRVQVARVLASPYSEPLRHWTLADHVNDWWVDQQLTVSDLSIITLLHLRTALGSTLCL